jgi:hypothetical protein
LQGLFNPICLTGNVGGFSFSCCKPILELADFHGFFRL